MATSEHVVVELGESSDEDIPESTSNKARP
jgi:hypothetical protein